MSVPPARPDSTTLPPPAPSHAAPVAPPTPDRIMQIQWGASAMRALQTALELGVFTEIAAGQNTIAAVARATRSSPRGMRMLLDALVSLGLLSREGRGAAAAHALAPDAAAFLVATSPAYLGDFLRFHGTVVEGHWRGLTDCVRTGRPMLPLDKPAEGVPFWHQLVDGLFNLGFLAATQVGEELGRLYPGRDVRLLDVAAGSGVWGIGAATSNPRVRATAFDLPETLEHAKRHARRSPVASRIDFLPGDLRTADLGEATYDAAVLGHIVHSEGETHARALFRKLARAIRPGGTLVIVEFVPDEGRSSPTIPLLFALNMLVLTTDGDTYTLSDYRSWLEEAGFRDVRQVPAAAPSPLIYATRG